MQLNNNSVSICNYFRFIFAENVTNKAMVKKQKMYVSNFHNK